MLNKIIYTILGFGAAVLFFPHVARDYAAQSLISGASTGPVAAVFSSSPELSATQDAPVLTAKSALAVDLNSGAILYSKKINERLPIASLTKLMTALVVLDRVDLDGVLVVPMDDLKIVGTSIGLVAGEKITVRDLLKAMLIPSSNDAALLLAYFTAGTEADFVQLMNNKATQMGLINTHFTNSVGWDIDDNYSDSLDLLKIAKEFLKYSELSDITSTKETIIRSVDNKYSHQLTTTNKLLLDDPEVIGLKTGFTAKALGNLIALANHSGHKVLTIVLGSENREDDSQKFLNWLFSVYKW